MSEDIFDREATHEEIRELRLFVNSIAKDYVELSHDKVRWQRDDYMRSAQRIVTKYAPPYEETPCGPLDDDF